MNKSHLQSQSPQFRIMAIFVTVRKLSHINIKTVRTLTVCSSYPIQYAQEQGFTS